MTHTKDTHGLLLAAALAFSLAAVPIAAQDSEATEPGSGDSGGGLEWDFTVGGGFEHQFETDFDGDNGDFDLTHFDIGFGVGMKFNPDLRLDLNFGYAHDGYDFGGSRGLGGADPWDDINTFRFGVLATWTFDDDDRWSVFGGPIFAFSAESGADTGESFTGGGIIGVGYRASDTFTIGLGVGVMSQIEDSAAVFPIVSLNWDITDTIAVTTVGSVGASGGGGVELGWEFVEHWTLSGGVQYRSARFRIDGTSRRTKDGVGENTSLPIYAKLAWQPTEQAELSIMGGVIAGGELRLENSRGHKIMEEDYDVAPFVGLRFSLRF